MYHLVIPRRHFAQTVTALLRQPDMAGLGLAGRNYTRTDMAFLCRDLALVPVTEPVPALAEDHVRRRATSLAQMGVQTLGLIDPDVVEAHHLDAMDGVTPQDLGRPKVAAVAAHLQALCPALTVTALPHRVIEHPALVRIKEADVPFCYVDNDAARLVTTTLATLYLKPLSDVGTGIFSLPPRRPSPQRLGPSPHPHHGRWAATCAACSQATPVSCAPEAWCVKRKPAGL